MAFKMKGSAFKQGGSGIQGTSGHASALKQKKDEQLVDPDKKQPAPDPNIPPVPNKDKEFLFKDEFMKQPKMEGLKKEDWMKKEKTEDTAATKMKSPMKDTKYFGEITSASEANRVTKHNEKHESNPEWDHEAEKKAKQKEKVKKEAERVIPGAKKVAKTTVKAMEGTEDSPNKMKSPLEQRPEDEQALPFNPDAISNVPGYMQSKVTGGSDWTVHEDTPKEGRGIKYRGEGGRYHVYDPSKWKDSKRIHPGGEPVDFTKSMWDQKTQSWVPLQDFKLEKPEEGVADMTDLPPEEGQPFEGEAKQVEKKMPWWKRRRNR